MKKEFVRTSPRIDQKHAEFYKSISPWGESVNGGLEYVSQAFPQLFKITVHSLKGRFSRGELMLMIDVQNGTFLTAQLAGQHLSAQIADGIALDRLDEKWEIEADALNAKVAALTIFEVAALELWIQIFWNQKEHGNIEEYVAELAAPMPGKGKKQERKG